MADEDIRESDNVVQGALNLLRNLRKEIMDAQEGKADMTEVISKIKSELDKLNESAEKIYEKTGMNKEEIAGYIENQKNFSEDEWDLLDKIKKETDSCKDAILKTVEKETISDMISHSKNKRKKKVKKKRWISS